MQEVFIKSPDSNPRNLHNVLPAWSVLWFWSYGAARITATSLRDLFETPPTTIIYDNSCKLHQYLLNREPTHFKDTRFFVDRFHWHGHIGCSSGYSMDKYATQSISSINSQVNEQVNVLQRIKGQLAYMKPDNFVSCEALSCRNKHGQKSSRFKYFMFVAWCIHLHSHIHIYLYYV